MSLTYGIIGIAELDKYIASSYVLLHGPCEHHHREIEYHKVLVNCEQDR